MDGKGFEIISNFFIREKTRTNIIENAPLICK